MGRLFLKLKYTVILISHTRKIKIDIYVYERDMRHVWSRRSSKILPIS